MPQSKIPLAWITLHSAMGETGVLIEINRKPVTGVIIMSLDKKYLKSKPICKVKFIAPPELAREARKIYLAGDFNNWDYQVTPLKKQKDGTFATTLELEAGSEYEYRYVLDGERWENDYAADKYVPSKICNVDNSVVVV